MLVCVSHWCVFRREHPAAKQLAGPFPGDGPVWQQQQHYSTKQLGHGPGSCTALAPAAAQPSPTAAAAAASEQHVAPSASPGRVRSSMWENDPLLDERIRWGRAGSSILFRASSSIHLHCCRQRLIRVGHSLSAPGPASALLTCCNLKFSLYNSYNRVAAFSVSLRSNQ